MKTSPFFRSNFSFRANLNDIPFAAVESTCNKSRRKSLPTTPQTVAEINDAFKLNQVQQNFGMTERSADERSTPFFKGAVECDSYSFCVFASNDAVKAIQENTEESKRKLYADGTFKICPVGPFKQVLIIFAELLGHVCLFILLCL